MKILNCGIVGLLLIAALVSGCLGKDSSKNEIIYEGVITEVVHGTESTFFVPGKQGTIIMDDDTLIIAYNVNNQVYKIGHKHRIIIYRDPIDKWNKVTSVEILD